MKELYAEAKTEGLETPLKPPSLIVVASACPQLFCRVVGLLAQQGGSFDLIHARRRGNRMRILIRPTGIAPERAPLLAAKLRAIPDVDDVILG